MLDPRVKAAVTNSESESQDDPHRAPENTPENVPESGHGAVGLFGGTFDPPHLGHLVVADQVRAELGLDEVWFVVANDPWQKSRWRTVTPATTRLKLVETALSGIAGLRASDVELEDEGPSYTIETLTTLQARHPNTEFSVIVGQDAASRLGTWERSERLREIAEIVVVNRPGSPSAIAEGWRLTRVDVPPLDVSSTDLRARFAAGRSVRFLVPDAVIDLVHQLGIYRPES